MMNDIRIVLKEQIDHWKLIKRISNFEIKGIYQTHYLGALWQYINPVLQVLVYWMVFGLGIRGGISVGETPYILWMLMGIIPWFFIAPSILKASNSIHQKIGLVSKMKFPVSLLPTVAIISNVKNFFVLSIVFFVILVLYGFEFTIFILQLPYFVMCLFIFVFSFSILSSTISTLIRDYQMLLQSVVRMLFFLTPILWDVSSAPDLLANILQLNPFYYIVDGIRASFLGDYWFFKQPVYFLYFWSFTFMVLYIGSKIHIRFRKDFVDYI